MRQALSLAIDRTEIVKNILGLGETEAYTYVPPGIRGYVPPPGLGHDPARARSLLAEAGYPGGKGFPPIKLLYNTHEAHKQIATVARPRSARRSASRPSPSTRSGRPTSRTLATSSTTWHAPARSGTTWTRIRSSTCGSRTAGTTRGATGARSTTVFTGSPRTRPALSSRRPRRKNYRQARSEGDALRALVDAARTLARPRADRGDGEGPDAGLQEEMKRLLRGATPESSPSTST